MIFWVIFWFKIEKSFYFLYVCFFILRYVFGVMFFVLYFMLLGFEFVYGGEVEMWKFVFRLFERFWIVVVELEILGVILVDII